MNVRVHEAAAEELLAARAWYDQRKPGLGAELLADAERAIERIRALPEAAPRSPGSGRPNVRRLLTQRFPFAVIYVVRSNEIVVLAFSHLHRRPRYWASRVP